MLLWLSFVMSGCLLDYQRILGSLLEVIAIMTQQRWKWVIIRDPWPMWPIIQLTHDPHDPLTHFHICDTVDNGRSWGAACAEGSGSWGGVSPLPLAAPSQNFFFVFFLLKYHFDAFWHVYFLSHTPMGSTPPPLSKNVLPSQSWLSSYAYAHTFMKICIIFVPLVFSRTHAATMLQWSGRPCVETTRRDWLALKIIWVVVASAVAIGDAVILSLSSAARLLFSTEKASIVCASRHYSPRIISRPLYSFPVTADCWRKS